MTVSSQTNKVIYIGNGVAKEFAIPFSFLEQEHIKVRQKKNDIQTERTDWTVKNGNLVFADAPESGAEIAIVREVPLTQETDYRDNEILHAETLERNFDKLTMQVQQLKEQADRAVTVDIFDDTQAAELIPSIRKAVSDCQTAVETTAANAANSETAAASSAAQALLAAQTAQKYIGETVFSLLPISAAGYHLLDGSLISGQGVYADFVNYIASLVPDYPNLFVQEAVWQSSVASFGVCGKFVYDANAGTVRLPKVTGFVEGTLDASALGDLVQAGLPNITGTAKYNKSEINSSGGALKSTEAGTQALYSSNGAGSSLPGVLNFNASLSNGIYGRSTTVQPQSIKGFMYIVIAASAKSTVQADIDNLMNGVNALVSTLSSNKYVTDCYVNGNNWYRVWSDGWIEQGGQTTSSTGVGTLNFIKPFLTTNYLFLTHTKTGNGDYTVRNTVEVLGTRTTTGINITGTPSFTNSYTWYACGY